MEYLNIESGNNEAFYRLGVELAKMHKVTSKKGYGFHTVSKLV